MTKYRSAATPGRALGYAEVSSIPSVFPNLDDTTIVIRLSRYGDANLDGVVNPQDFNRLVANFGSATALGPKGTSTTTAM